MKNWASYVLSCHCGMISVEFLELKVGKAVLQKKSGQRSPTKKK